MERKWRSFNNIDCGNDRILDLYSYYKTVLYTFEWHSDDGAVHYRKLRYSIGAFMFRNLEINIFIRIFVKVGVSVIVYFALQIVTKNQIVMDTLYNILKKAKVKVGKK